ncbi:hypothetical protein B0J12DRAFT_318277 [Macrophomina phaseolina]|uniref:EamA domain-containing protein n=1 Tax=Macrophomina phaseolina TaxID=35725 RepID=A0ABQ8FW98_9PEZI|nr:hypothetical protein B0J12DRAFT_318277 [Macrophomina phaseolina]
MSSLPSNADGTRKAVLVSSEAPPALASANDPLSPKLEGKGYGANPNSGSLELPSNAALRVPSPAPSALSFEDYPSVHTGGSSTFLLSHPISQDALSYSAEKGPATWRGRLKAYWSRNKGLALVLISQFFGVCMNVSTRILEIEGNNGHGYHPFQVLFARMSITLAFALLYVWWQKVEHAPFGQKEVRWLLALRGFGGFFGVFGMYYSLLYLPLSDATVITFLAPSLACFACSLLINEPFTRMEQVAALISLIGVVLIARPTFLFSTPDPQEPNTDPSDGSTTSPTSGAGDYNTVTPEQRALAVAVALLGVLGAATAYTTLRWIGKRAHALISVSWFAAWCTLVSVIAMASIPSIPFAFPTSLYDWGLLFFLGTCGFVMQFLLAAGLQQEKSSRATNMVYCQMLFALAGDKLIFGTTPDAWGWAGSSLILGSAIYVAVRKEQGKAAHRKEMRDEERGLVAGMDEDDELPPGSRVAEARPNDDAEARVSSRL